MLDIKWNEEAAGVISDVKQFVKSIQICQNQPDIDQMVLINLETFEDEKFCVKLCANGFGIIGRHFDEIGLTEIEKWYETPYAMLSDISESYMKRFNESLADRLKIIEPKST